MSRYECLGNKSQELRDGRRESGDGRRGERRQESGVGRREMGDGRQESGDGRHESGDGRQESGDGRLGLGFGLYEPPCTYVGNSRHNKSDLELQQKVAYSDTVPASPRFESPRVIAMFTE